MVLHVACQKLILACFFLWCVLKALFLSPYGGTAAAAPPPSGLATLPSVGAVP